MKLAKNGQYMVISIHAPHARSDMAIIADSTIKDISIHAPHARSDSLLPKLHRGLYQYFNPRSSCEERPHSKPHGRAGGHHFNPRSSCEERPNGRSSMSGATYFNPRSSCEERQCKRAKHPREPVFQSTLLMRGATRQMG